MAHRTCTLEDCERPHVSRGYCGPHYRRFNLYGDPRGGHYTKRATQPNLCTIDGCERRRYSRGLCPAHAARQAKHGDPTGGRASSKLAIAGKPCTVDDCDGDAKAGGMCWSHYNRQRYLADPETWARYSAEYRARQVGATVEKFTAAEILTRDEWQCQLCGDPIPQDAKHPHPLSASIDHVIPLSRGGEHSRRNTQASHLRCNLSKWAKTA